MYYYVVMVQEVVDIVYGGFGGDQFLDIFVEQFGCWVIDVDFMLVGFVYDFVVVEVQGFVVGIGIEFDDVVLFIVVDQVYSDFLCWNIVLKRKWCFYCKF